MIQKDENLTGMLLDYFSDNLLSQDDGTGPRLLWALQRLEMDDYDNMEAKKKAYQQVVVSNSKKKNQKASELKNLLIFETSLIQKHYPEE